MKKTSVSLVALMSALIVSSSAHAGISDMVNSFFTFRHDQKPLIAPERTLPPKHIIEPYYDAREAEKWSDYYTREDLHAVEHMDGSSMVMRRDPNYRPPQRTNPSTRGGDQYASHGNPNNGYTNYVYDANGNPVDPRMGYAGIQRRANMNALEKYEGNVYIGDPGNNPFKLDNSGVAGKKTAIGAPKTNWKSAPSDRVQPRAGDYDYVMSHKGRSSNNAFGEYANTVSDDANRGVEVTRSSGYFQSGEVPLPSQNDHFYSSNVQNHSDASGAHYSSGSQHSGAQYGSHMQQSGAYAEHGNAQNLGNRNLPNNYIVQPRDSLSGISNQEQIYGDWKMWPLIYDENRNQINDPDLIHPGQNLGIPRGTSEAQHDDARRRALEKKAPYSFYDGK